MLLFPIRAVLCLVQLRCFTCVTVMFALFANVRLKGFFTTTKKDYYCVETNKAMIRIRRTTSKNEIHCFFVSPLMIASINSNTFGIGGRLSGLKLQQEKATIQNCCGQSAGIDFLLREREKVKNERFFVFDSRRKKTSIL